MLNIEFFDKISEYVYYPQIWDTDDTCPLENIIINNELEAVSFPFDRCGICYLQFSIPNNAKFNSLYAFYVYYDYGNAEGNIQLCLNYKIYYNSCPSSSSSSSSSVNLQNDLYDFENTVCDNLYLSYNSPQLVTRSGVMEITNFRKNSFILLKLYRNNDIEENYPANFYLVDFVLYAYESNK